MKKIFSLGNRCWVYSRLKFNQFKDYRFKNNIVETTPFTGTIIGNTKNGIFPQKMLFEKYDLFFEKYLNLDNWKSSKWYGCCKDPAMHNEILNIDRLHIHYKLKDWMERVKNSLIYFKENKYETIFIFDDNCDFNLDIELILDFQQYLIYNNYNLNNFVFLFNDLQKYNNKKIKIDKFYLDYNFKYKEECYKNNCKEKYWSDYIPNMYDNFYKINYDYFMEKLK